MSSFSKKLTTWQYMNTLVLPCCPPCKFKVLRRLKGFPRKPENLGHHIRLKRLEKGLIQRDVAKLLQVSKQTISNWEQGYTQPPLRLMKDISLFLGYCYYEVPATTIALKIKYLRYYLFGMDSRSFAKYTKLDPSSLLAWERGERMPNKKSLSKISNACNAALAKISDQVKM